MTPHRISAAAPRHRRPRRIAKRIDARDGYLHFGPPVVRDGWSPPVLFRCDECGQLAFDPSNPSTYKCRSCGADYIPF